MPSTEEESERGSDCSPSRTPLRPRSSEIIALTLGNHTATAQTASVTATLTYTSIYGPLISTIPFKLKLNAGQTLSRSVRFTIQSWFPRGIYTLNTTATDGSGGTAGSSTTMTAV